MPPRASPSSPRSAVDAPSWHSLAKTTPIMIARRLLEHNDRTRLGTAARGDTIDYDNGLRARVIEARYSTHSRRRHRSLEHDGRTTLCVEPSFKVRHDGDKIDYDRGYAHWSSKRDTPRVARSRKQHRLRSIVGTRRRARDSRSRLGHGRSRGHDWLRSRTDHWSKRDFPRDTAGIDARRVLRFDGKIVRREHKRRIRRPDTGKARLAERRHAPGRSAANFTRQRSDIFVAFWSYFFLCFEWQTMLAGLR